MAFLERSHLEIVRAVELHGTMTAAASALHLTQSALSHSMRKLEDRIGVKLWYREGRSLRLTPAGTHLLATANRLIPQFVHTEEQLGQFARGERGTLRIGMECYPCYQWLQKIVAPYLRAWPLVDFEVKQKFQFGGIGALFAHEIDLLVTPDPLQKKSLHFEPVFDYEQVLVVSSDHPLAEQDRVMPQQLGEEVLFTYPVSRDRLDIYTCFLAPAGRTVRKQKAIESTDIMLQMVACGRGVAALPRWLVEEFSEKYPVRAVRLGSRGVQKQIFLGVRRTDLEVDYLKAFMDLARDYSEPP
ncbi:LysR family transcriptional regulator [Roseofilum casamattae]|uniref:HTH-type transcriptional regulator MetR n=1 Tax=Roseofilum casamattae BLCC-M143 TaxID=3022442 RepID=A0ABT7C495_9CYAN|nr:LysR family transcriptional regulator [Roseofilum casamattae]MDJ1185498.1 LysR family transcriptional regulator [Roseofilum casamattae BLCC-M143]